MSYTGGSNKLNILHLANHCRLGHGNVHAAVDLACSQAASSETVFYGGEGGEFANLLMSKGVNFVHMPQKTRNPLKLFKSLIRLVLLIKRHRIDIVHAHMMAGAALGYMASRLTGVKLVTTVHNSFDSHSIIMRLGDRIVAVSEAERKLLIGRGFPSARLATVINGPLGSARFPGEMQEGIDSIPRPSITTICGLHPRKGVEYLIRAFAVAQQSVDCYLNIVGDGPDRERLEDLVKENELGARVKFHGTIKNPKNILERTDIFVLASLSEPFGLVNIEARSCGCAVIATEVGGVPETLDLGRAGILVPPKDSNAIAGRLIELLSDDRKLSYWRDRAKEDLYKFDTKLLYDNYREVYADALGA